MKGRLFFRKRIMGRLFLRKTLKVKVENVNKRHDEENGGTRKGYTMTGYPFMEYIQVKIDGREVKRE